MQTFQVIETTVAYVDLPSGLEARDRFEAQRAEDRDPKGRERGWGSRGGGSEPLPSS